MELGFALRPEKNIEVFYEIIPVIVPKEKLSKLLNE